MSAQVPVAAVAAVPFGGDLLLAATHQRLQWILTVGFESLDSLWGFIEESGAVAPVLPIVTELLESVLCDSVFYYGVFTEAKDPFP